MSAYSMQRTSLFTVVLALILSVPFNIRAQGIKVHGDWTITLRNADGSVDSSHQFQNALVASGAQSLANVLAHTGVVPSKWVVILTSPTPPCAGIKLTTQPGDCSFAEPGLPAEFTPASATLVASVPQSGPDAGKVVLSGSVKAAFGGTVGTVFTELLCVNADGLLLKGCGGIAGVTAHILGGPVSVQANQTIDVIVKISFS